MICPTCSARMRCTESRAERGTGRVLRRHFCANCATRLKTVEIATEDLKKLQRERDTARATAWPRAAFRIVDLAREIVSTASDGTASQ